MSAPVLAAARAACRPGARRRGPRSVSTAGYSITAYRTAEGWRYAVVAVLPGERYSGERLLPAAEATALIADVDATRASWEAA